MKPGAYLRSRREAAKLSIGECARQLALMHFGLSRIAYRALLTELEEAEASTSPLTPAQADLLRNVFPFDRALYRQLVALDWKPRASAQSKPILATEGAC